MILDGAPTQRPAGYAPEVRGARREDSLGLAHDLVRSGASVDVVGSRGSGRSTFLSDLQARLEDASGTVVRLRGIASFRQHPLAALHAHGMGSTRDARPAAAVQDAVQALGEALSAPGAALLVDDWDDLDETTWGVVETVRGCTGVPVVVARLRGLPARHTPSGLIAATLSTRYVIDLAPLGFDELERAAVERLGAPIEAESMSRLTAKSGGNIGLALGVLEIAVREQRLRRTGGTWAATRDLWSPALRGTTEAHLEHLDTQSREALETIALIGLADLETVRRLVEWEVLESLEGRGLVRLVPNGDGHLVNVEPPLLVDFFRNEPISARRMRLSDRIRELLGSTDPVEAVLADGGQLPEDLAASHALVTRLVREHTRSRRIVARAEWDRRRGAATAVAYLHALFDANAAPDLIEHVFDRTDARIGDAESRVELAVLRARWRARVTPDADPAIRELRAATSGLGTFADALAVRFETSVRRVPHDVEDRLEVDESHPRAVRLQVREAHAEALVIMGRFEAARRVLEPTLEDATRDRGDRLRGLFGLVLLGEGDHAGSLEWALRGLDEARSELDVEAMRMHSYVAALALTMAGRLEEVENILHAILALGAPGPFSIGAHGALLNLGRMTGIRRGNTALSMRCARDLSALPVVDSLMPGACREWGSALSLAFEGRVEEAAARYWSSSESLWNRGARFAASIGFLVSLEMSPDSERLSVLSARLDDLDGAFLGAHCEFLRARSDGDADGMLGLVPALDRSGQPGLAVVAFELACAWLGERGHIARARATERRKRTYIDRLARHPHDPIRFAPSTSSLTERELEIARLMTAGHSNPQIASRLVLSTRTVESHLHRILRKTRLTNRQELAAFIKGSVG